MKRRHSVLIAENRQFLVDVIRESFRQCDFDCICVNTEREVFERLQDVDAAVVGLDVCPGDQARRIDMIAEIRSKCEIPLLALTSLQYSAVRIELLRRGADDVLTKPFNPEELVVRMCKLIERCRE